MTCFSRWLKHWQSLPLRNRIGSALCVAALVACVIALVLQIGALFADDHKAVPTADSAAVHSRVWDKTGPLLEQAVRHADLALDKHLASIHGEQGAVFVVSKPRAMQLVLRHGEEAATALVKSRGVALPAVESLGRPAIRAFGAIGSPQNARRLAMMAADGGELARIGRTPELLAVIEKYGDQAMQFIWNHKGALAVSATLAAFLAEPEPCINGARELAQTVIKPIADVPAIAAKEDAAEVARKTNWTLVFLAVIAALTLLAAARPRLFGRRRPLQAKEP